MQFKIDADLRAGLEANPNPRQEVEAIGQALVDIAAAKAPLDVGRMGDLLKRLSVVYSRGVNAQETAQRRRA